MCIFSRPVRDVARTRIFARLSGTGTQFLVYSMTYSADEPLAMILPLPILRPADERSIRFINLKSYPKFFDDLDRGFPETLTYNLNAPSRGGYGGGAPRLTVYPVGDFIASFVPRLADFRRLDSRFNLPSQTWDQLPLYQDYGFAVFQLSAKKSRTEVHPMALEFQTRMPKALFLPTVHVHDGKIHPMEAFDHALYVQDFRLTPTKQIDSFGNPVEVPEAQTLVASTRVLKSLCDIRRAEGVLEPNEIAFKCRLRGILPNQDTIIPCGS